ncbi:hypothetical protein H8K20_03835 [Neobittarella massiliensis]|uniref:Gram-positive cocci surface proteins LPxTG domain-containing protein n=1 Tax=Neobittarella massiliensis (ex Bilen et al. 2018) TaxID=2041842 RepID=A0A8J6IL89_9FIRM|nr:hypothetical protein [Neobittarella massiliensis]MBC3515529.1 hypothetical protein [Neobittarella massiliensis]
MRKKSKLLAVLTAALLTVSAVPLSAASAESSEWITGNGYGSIQANEDGTCTYTGDPALNTDNSHCGPYTKAGGASLADGETLDAVDVTIDPASMTVGEKFALSVSMNDKQGQYRTELMVQFWKDNDGSVSVAAGMQPGYQGKVTEAGVYTLQYRYFDHSGDLYAEFSLLKNGEQVSTTGDIDMKVKSADCGTRGYIWFNDISVSGGLKVGRPVANVVITDCGAWGDSWSNAYNLGWKYVGGFDTDSITAIQVGMRDADGKLIVAYTADKEQLAYQAENGYITAEGLSSAPFYQVTTSGVELVEGRDQDWTVIKGEAYAAWKPAVFFAEIVTPEKSYPLETAYDGQFAPAFQCAHKQLSAVDGIEATCIEHGNIPYWYCDNCKQYFADEDCQQAITAADILLAATGHQAQKVEGKEATATEEGNVAYWYCAACGKYFADADLTQEITREDTVLPATGEQKEPEPSDGQKPESEDTQAPATGDSSVLLWGGVLVLSAAAITGLSLYKRKKQVR